MADKNLKLGDLDTTIDVGRCDESAREQAIQRVRVTLNSNVEDLKGRCQRLIDEMNLVLGSPGLDDFVNWIESVLANVSLDEQQMQLDESSVTSLDVRGVLPKEFCQVSGLIDVLEKFLPKMKEKKADYESKINGIDREIFNAKSDLARFVQKGEAHLSSGDIRDRDRANNIVSSRTEQRSKSVSHWDKMCGQIVEVLNASGMDFRQFVEKFGSLVDGGMKGDVFNAKEVRDLMVNFANTPDALRFTVHFEVIAAVPNVDTTDVDTADTADVAEQTPPPRSRIKIPVVGAAAILLAAALTAKLGSSEDGRASGNNGRRADVGPAVIETTPSDRELTLLHVTLAADRGEITPGKVYATRSKLGVVGQATVTNVISRGEVRTVELSIRYQNSQMNRVVTIELRPNDITRTRRPDLEEALKR